jgi:hypothetical protein
LGVNGRRHVKLKTSPPSVAGVLENVGASTSHNPMVLHGLLQGQVYILHDRNNNNDGDEHLRVFRNVKMNCLIVCQLGLCTDAAESSGLLSTDHFKDVFGRSENITKTDLKN